MTNNPDYINLETWNNIAEIYQEKFMSLSLYDDTYDIFCEYVTRLGARVLEIGCGPGNITKYLLQKRADLNIDAVDIAPNMISLAQTNNPGANFAIMDCRDIRQLNKKYDAVICGFCIPYLSDKDCEVLIKDSAFLLNPGGILYISSIEGNYKDSGLETGSSGDQCYVYYHSENSLTEYFKNNDLELLEMIPKNYPKTKEAYSTHLIMIARKN